MTKLKAFLLQVAVQFVEKEMPWKNKNEAFALSWSDVSIRTQSINFRNSVNFTGLGHFAAHPLTKTAENVTLGPDKPQIFAGIPL
jgi:hypothetical protein